MALYQRLALERRKWLAELILACLPHVKNKLAVRACETPHNRSDHEAAKIVDTSVVRQLSSEEVVVVVLGRARGQVEPT